MSHLPSLSPPRAQSHSDAPFSHILVLHPVVYGADEEPKRKRWPVAAMRSPQRLPAADPRLPRSPHDSPLFNVSKLGWKDNGDGELVLSPIYPMRLMPSQVAHLLQQGVQIAPAIMP